MYQSAKIAKFYSEDCQLKDPQFDAIFFDRMGRLTLRALQIT